MYFGGITLTVISVIYAQSVSGYLASSCTPVGELHGLHVSMFLRNIFGTLYKQVHTSLFGLSVSFCALSYPGSLAKCVQGNFSTGGDMHWQGTMPKIFNVDAFWTTTRCRRCLKNWIWTVTGL